MKNKTGIILACLAALITLIGFLFFEIRKVPDVIWLDKNDFEDEEPQGYYVFKESIIRYFEGVDYEISKEFRDTATTNGLYIHILGNYDDTSMDTLMDLIGKGNDVLLLAKTLPYQLKDTLSMGYSTSYDYQEQFNFNFRNDSLKLDSTIIYRFVDREFQYDQTEAYQLLDPTYNYNDNTILVEANDSLVLLARFRIGEGTLYYHMIPSVFHNHSYRQPQMFDYMERMLSHFDPAYIVFLRTLNGIKPPPAEHPLQFIMSSKPLKTAYFLFVLGLLSYAIFGGKRRQKAIPITDKNENTSLEYIDTVSQLFYQQNKHEKLVAHMRNIFYHKMEQKYFLKKDHPTYVETLAKKSKIPQSDLQYIIDRFRNLEEKYTFREDQLVTLNRRLEQIYQFINQKSNS